jgi:hypothetical protein
MKDIDAQKIWEAVQKVDEADYVPPQDDDALARAKQRGYDEPSDNSTDTHLQWQVAQDTWHETLTALEPLDRLAAKYGGEDINPTGGTVSGGNIIDWLAKEINRPGSDFVGHFEQQIMIEQ